MPEYQRMVLIDDNEADNLYHGIMIRKAGFGGELVVLDSGEAGLEYLRSSDLDQPTCIFLDINMPRLSGFDVAEQAAPLLRGKPSAVLVMLTSSGSPSDRERALGMEVISGYVTKPLTVQVVRDLLAKPA